MHPTFFESFFSKAPFNETKKAIALSDKTYQKLLINTPENFFSSTTNF